MHLLLHNAKFILAVMATASQTWPAQKVPILLE